MAYKLINATQAKPGTAIMIEGNPCVVRSNDISKSGKHGASKCRIEAIGVIDDKKRVIAVPGSERFEVPMINKNKGQILSVGDSNLSVMDLESFETFDIPTTQENKELVKEGDTVEYWDVEGHKMIKRTL